jgi:hypothetical protein
LIAEGFITKVTKGTTKNSKETISVLGGGFYVLGGEALRNQQSLHSFCCDAILNLFLINRSETQY